MKISLFYKIKISDEAELVVNSIPDITTIDKLQKFLDHIREEAILENIRHSMYYELKRRIEFLDEQEEWRDTNK